MNTMMKTGSSDLRLLEDGELDTVSGADTIVRHTTIIMEKGTLSIGTIQIDGGLQLPSATWVPHPKGGEGKGGGRPQ